MSCLSIAYNGNRCASSDTFAESCIHRKLMFCGSKLLVGLNLDNLLIFLYVNYNTVSILILLLKHFTFFRELDRMSHDFYYPYCMIVGVHICVQLDNKM